MQRMFNLDKWTRLKEGESLEFANPRPRNVRLEVNAPVKTALHVVDHEGEVHFLALVEGRDTVEFGSTGSFALSVEGADCLIYTADGADISQKVLAPVAFTRIVERRRRNPELEQMMALMNRNMEMRLERQARELEQRYIDSRATAPAADHRGNGAPANPAPESAPAGSGADVAPASGKDASGAAGAGGSSDNAPG